MTMALRYKVKPNLNAKIKLVCSDITTLEVDAITNAANKTLLGGGGVDGAIHRAAGPDLLLECEKLNGCKTGSAKMTKGYKLPAKHVIHAVGPIGQKPTLLRSCYETCLNIANEANLCSIAFPCISTGIFGYPNKAAAKVVLRTVREWLERNEDSSLKEVVFCLFLPVDVRLYNTLKQNYFPNEESEVVVISDDEEPQPEESMDDFLDVDIVNEILSSDDSFVTAPGNDDIIVAKDDAEKVAGDSVQPPEHNKEEFGSSVDKEVTATTDSAVKEPSANLDVGESENLQAAKRRKASEDKDVKENVPITSESVSDNCAEPMDIPHNETQKEDKMSSDVLLKESDKDKKTP